MRRLVLTGGIATGKSTFLKGLLTLYPGLGVFDCDAAVHQLFTKAAVLTKLRELFGECVIEDGHLDRAALRDLVFADEGQRRLLEGLLHPLVRSGCEESFEAYLASQPNGMFVADVPLYFETKGTYPNEAVVVVATTPATQRERLMRRSRLNPEEAERIIHSQIPIEEKALHADVLIWNEGPPPRLEDQMKLFLSRFPVESEARQS